MWVLIVLYSGYQMGAIGLTQEFTSKDRCEIAIAQIRKETRSASLICVEK